MRTAFLASCHKAGCTLADAAGTSKYEKLLWVPGKSPYRGLVEKKAPASCPAGEVGWWRKLSKERVLATIVLVLILSNKIQHRRLDAEQVWTAMDSVEVAPTGIEPVFWP